MPDSNLLQRVSDLLGRKQLTQNEYQNWAAGPANGGPNGDGVYPLTDPSGFVQNVPSPAKLQPLIEGKFTALFDDTAEALEQQKSWLAGTRYGGPFADGRYPVTLSTGAVVNIPCPARLQDDRVEIGEIVGKGSLIALVGDRVYATLDARDAVAVPAAGSWCLVHSDPDYGACGFYLGDGTAWALKISLASEALLVALGANLRAPVLAQMLGRPTDPSRFGAAVSGTLLFLWNDPVDAPGLVTGLRLFAAATGTITLQTYSRSGDTMTKKQSVAIAVTATGLQTLPVDVPVDAGDYIGIVAPNILTATSTAADAGGWWQIHPDPDTRTVGAATTSARLEAQFQLSIIEQTVNAQAFGHALDDIADLLSRSAALEEQAALMWRPVDQYVGLPAGVAPATGTGVSASMFIWADPVARAGTLAELRFFAVAGGTVTLARFSKSGSTLTKEASVDIAIGATGLTMLTPSDFGEFTLAAGEYLALAGDGVFTSKVQAADGAGWWQGNAEVPQFAVGTPTTNIRLHAGFRVSQPIQFVTAERFAAVEEQGMDQEARLEAVEEKVALLASDVAQTVGRRDTPIAGNPVSNSCYIWNAPIAHDGTLSLVEIFVTATGDFTLVRWRRDDADPNTIYREDVRTITATATGAQSFTPADFGGPMPFEEGDLIGLVGEGLFPSTSGTTDDDGWWQVVDGLDTRTLGTLYTSNRLEASFRVDQNYQVVTAQAYLALQQQVEELASSGVGSDIPGGALVKATDWYNDAEAEAHKAPLMGGRAGRPWVRSSGRRTLAHLATVADVANGRSIAGLSDEAAADALYSPTALRLATTGGTEAVLAPAQVNAAPVDVRGGIIRWSFKPLANIYNAIDSFSIELHSAGSPTAPTGNYHRLVPYNAPYDLRLRLTSRNGTGRWQGYSVAASQFSAVGSGADLSAVKFAILKIRSSSGNSLSLYVGNVEFAPNRLGKAKCVISFDDGRLPQITYVAPLMARYGFPAVLFPSPVAMTVDVAAGHLTSQQIRNLHDHLGWQIGSQAWTTEDNATIDGMSENQFTAELAKLRAWHNAMGVTGGEHGSYFSGVTAVDMIAFPAFRKHFRSMRSYYAGRSSGDPFLYGETFPFGDPMSVRAYAPETLNTTANGQQAIAHVDQAIANTGIAYFGYHDPTLSANIQAGFEALLAHLDANRDAIDVVVEEDLIAGVANGG